MPADLEIGAIAHPVSLPSDRAGIVHATAWKWYRRHVMGRFKRTARWEFWPPWAFYPPVLVYLLYLGFKHKNPTLFTAANPAIPGAGFIGESKYKILQALEPSSSVPKTTLLSAPAVDERITALEQFMCREGLTFPIVLKPDAGQRGSGVAIVRSNGQMRDYLGAATYPVIAQEYVGGLEFGIFYYRVPGERFGHIFSITEKHLPQLVGDGTRTLEELILADPRAVCMADLYCRQHSAHAKTVVADGKVVQLVELGTHCRGAIFLDGSYAVTAALEKAIDNIARTFGEFYFGRFDIRVPSVEDLRAGRNIRVLELNGVTSEATHIYDPRTSLIDAYKVLFRQWRIAFDIGERNRARGAQPTTLRRLLRAIFEYRQLSQGHHQQRSRQSMPEFMPEW